MDNYCDVNEYDVLLEIFRFIRDYSTSTYTLPNVCKKLTQYLRDSGYQTIVSDDTHRDYKILQVEAHQYKIIRLKDWLTYDVQLIA